jgi:hypothetical protein
MLFGLGRLAFGGKRKDVGIRVSLWVWGKCDGFLLCIEGKISDGLLTIYCL